MAAFHLIMYGRFWVITEETADEVRRYALLHLANMGVTIGYSDEVQHEVPAEIPTVNESVSA